MLAKYGAQVHAGNFYHAALAALGQRDTEVTQHLLGNTIGLIKDMDPNSGPYMTLSAAIIRKFAVEYFTGTGWGVKGGIGSDLKDNAHILMINGEPYSMREIMSRIQNTTNVEDLFRFARIQTYNKGLNVWDSSSDDPVTNALIRSNATFNKIHGLQMQIHYHPDKFLQTMGRKS
jgi:hypothetical protein